MKQQKQLGFEILERKNLKHFGGAYLKKSNPKVKRPITTKRSMHLVLRSSLAKNQLSLLKKEHAIKKIIGKQSKVFGVRVYRLANGGNHLHLIIRPRSREAFSAFIRSISGLIAREILGAERGRAQIQPPFESEVNSELKSKRRIQNRFWDQRPFTRIVEWGREFKTLCDYLFQNSLEAYGFIPYQERSNRQRFITSTA